MRSATRTERVKGKTFSERGRERGRGRAKRTVRTENWRAVVEKCGRGSKAEAYRARLKENEKKDGEGGLHSGEGGH